MDFQQGELAIEDLVKWARENDQQLTRNEAQTRFDLIDRLLGDCLGWQRGQIHVEVSQDRAFSDYELGAPYSRLLVEAKREDNYFVLPAGWTERTCNLRTLIKSGEGVEAAVNQALGYAQARGIPFAAICNGWQLAAFLASRTDGIPPLDGRALVFTSLSDIAAGFRDFWDHLSPAAVDAHALATALRHETRLPTPPKLSAQIDGYPSTVRRNSLQQSMQILGEIFVEDLASLEENEVRFLKSCYADSGALSQHALVSREILRTRYSLLFESEPGVSAVSATDTHGVDPSLLGDIAAASLKHRPIILLGDVGVGKSTFIRNLIHVEAREQLQNAVVLYLDFGKQPAIVTDLDLHVGNEIKRQLLSEYEIDVQADAFVRGVYHGQLEQFSSSLYGPLRETDPAEYARQEITFLADLLNDVDDHLRSSLEHITRARKKQVVIFLDNIDQRDPTFQERLYVIGQTMAESWPVTVFLALRPETFYKSKREGALSAYQPRVFTISPPRIEVVVKKRLNFALEKLREEGLRTPSGVGLHIEIGTLERYLSVIEHSLKANEQLVEFFENASVGNVRDALGFLEIFIGSGHVNPQRTLTRVGSSGPIRYRVPLHDVLRAVLYGDVLYYDPARSPIPNVFDIREAIPSEHFLVPLVVAFLRQKRGVSGISGTDGYVELSELVDFGQDSGFRPDQISDAIDRAHEGRLVNATGFGESAASESRACRVTTLGAYALQRLVGSFTYVDAVIVDCPIVDEDYRASIANLGPFDGLQERLERAELFADYLTECWKPLAGRNLPFEWPAAEQALRRDVAGIRSRTANRKP